MSTNSWMKIRPRARAGFDGPGPRWLLGMALAACPLLCLAAAALASDVEEDDEETIGDTGFSVPAEVARSKRHEAGDRGFSFLGGITAFWGGDDNVFRSPGELETHSSTWGNWGYLRADSRLGANRFLNTVKWKQDRFPGHGVVDANFVSSSNWFTRPIAAGLDLELDFDLSHRNDAAANISGLTYSRDYGYWRYAGETVLEWNPSRRHRLRLGVEGVVKNYEETAGLDSIDWKQWLATASYRFRLFSGQSVTATYVTGERGYEEEPAALETGEELPENPAERHRYRDLDLTYIARVTGHLGLQLGYDRASKEDLFRGYESRQSESVSAEIGLEIRNGLELKANGEREWRDYDHILGGADRALNYRRQEVGLGARARVLAPTWIFAYVGYYERETNKSTGTLYRSYRGTQTRGGVSVFF